MIRRLDHWMGTRLFHPPIILLCQRTGMTQFAVAAYAWLGAIFTIVPRLRFDGMGQIVIAALVSGLAVATTVATALVPDMPRRPSFFFRLFVWFVTLLDVWDVILRYRVAGHVDIGWSGAWDVLALTGEYAKTIATIPPKPNPHAQAGVFERPI